MAKKGSRRARLVVGSSVNRRTRLKRKLKRSEDARPVPCGSLIVQNWDANLPLADNYRRLGLCRDPNKESLLQIARAQKRRLTNLPEPAPTLTPASDDDNPVRDQLEDLAANPPRLATTMPRSMPIQEQAMLAALIKKHGDDVEAMARDIKLNRMQKTSAQLQPRLDLYRYLQAL